MYAIEFMECIMQYSLWHISGCIMPHYDVTSFCNNSMEYSLWMCMQYSIIGNIFYSMYEYAKGIMHSSILEIFGLSGPCRKIRLVQRTSTNKMSAKTVLPG